ncbi:MAG TPA: hypothetical protein VGL91_10625, partial [Acidobacteriota bacterium]
RYEGKSTKNSSVYVKTGTSSDRVRIRAKADFNPESEEFLRFLKVVREAYPRHEGGAFLSAELP